jgi:3',5'-cyclic AMP phosphodiesterase CpdA
MAIETPLLTIVQISDLHIGRPPDRSGNRTYDARVPALLRFHDIFSGCLGHHWRALSALDDFFGGLVEDGESPILIVNGDLTASGHPAEFVLADDFVGPAQGNTTLPTSLAVPDWAQASVPGTTIIGPGWNGFPSAADSRPDPPIPLPNGVSLRFIFLNSDADVQPYSWQRATAQGHFSTQVKALDKLLPPSGEREVRFLVVHHSLVGPWSPMRPHPVAFPKASGRPRRLEIGGQTLRLLEAALIRHRLKVVLTGHVHRPGFARLIARKYGRSVEVLEARSGSTAQLDRYPDEVLRKAGALRPLPPNSLILHRIVESSGATLLRSQAYWRARMDGSWIG